VCAIPLSFREWCTAAMQSWTNRRAWAALPAAIAVVAALTLPAPQAWAASDERSDTVGDAPGIIDIASFAVRNDNTRAVITSHVPGLKTRGGFAFGYGHSRNGGLIVFARKHAGQLAVDATYCGEIRCHDVDCAGLRVRWSTTKHIVQAIIPQRCFPARLPSPGVFTATSGSKTDYDDAGVLRVARG